MTAKEAADRLLSPPSKISRIETAERAASPRDVRDLCDIYGITDDEVRRQLMALAVEARERGWWQGAGLQPALERLIGLEGAAGRISEFEPLLVPGLLQTPEYARAMLDMFGSADPAVRDKALRIRLRRQELLSAADPPVFSFVIDEAVVRRMVGGAEVMRSQLEHFLAVAAVPHVSLRVVPFDAGAHHGMFQGFEMVDFPDDANGMRIPGLVFFENLYDGQTVDDAARIHGFAEAFKKIQDVALTQRESVDLLRRAKESVESLR